MGGGRRTGSTTSRTRHNAGGNGASDRHSPNSDAGFRTDRRTHRDAAADCDGRTHGNGRTHSNSNRHVSALPDAGQSGDACRGNARTDTSRGRDPH